MRIFASTLLALALAGCGDNQAEDVEKKEVVVSDETVSSEP